MALVDPTTVYAWNLPNDGSDDGAWGAALREIFGQDTTSGTAPNGGLDFVINAISVIANAALSRAGGSMTGEIDVLTERFVSVDLGSTMSGTITMDLDLANLFYGTATGTITFAFSNVPAATDGVFITLEITDGGSQTLNFPSSVEWPGGSPPTFTTSGVDVVTMYTRDGGTIWRAALAMADSS